MAAMDSPRKSFWKKGNNTKLPGRPQPVYRVQQESSVEHSTQSGTQPQHHSSSAQARPRSKTFEEYKKETDDVWDDKEEDFSELSLPSELEFSATSNEGGVSGEGPGGRPRVNSKGKGKSKQLKKMKHKELSRGTSAYRFSRVLTQHNQEFGLSTPDSFLREQRVESGDETSDLKSFFTDVVKAKASPKLRLRSHSERSKNESPLSEHAHRTFGDGIRERSPEFFDPPDRETMRLQKFGKLLAGPNTDLDELRKLSWSGIPPPVRATTWQILCGYLPANIDRREETLQRKRQEYRNFIDQYYHMRTDPTHLQTFKQISIDVPRMNPDIKLFQQQIVQECFQRILFIWSMRHPASGYVQGINDLVTPFFIVYLSYYISGDKNPETYDLSKLQEETLQMIEADSFWCMQKLLEGIQDNYTLAQPGVQTKIMALKDLIKRLDAHLDEHLSRNSVEYIQFAFRWMNNLLMREFPLRCVIRLWDSYLSERDGFAIFHVYVCAALLARFSEQIRKGKDFQEIMLFLQNLPTTNWKNDDIELLLAEAYKLKFMFADAPGHLTVVRTS